VAPQRLAQLFADLDSARFAVRQQATQELENLGELAEPALRQRLQDQPSPEVRGRIEQLLLKLPGAKPSAECLRGLRAVAVLEHVGSPEAHQLLEKIAGGTREAWLTQDAQAAMQRLARRPTDRP
jgi:hypothetical protein